jgi:hypothetical protein
MTPKSRGAGSFVRTKPALTSCVIAGAGLLALLLALIGTIAGPAGAVGPALSVTPSTNLADGQQVTVTGCNLGVRGAVGVVECGNADSNGTPLPGSAPATADCYGAESVGTQTILTTVANDGATTPYTVRTSGIGANSRKCITGGNFDCVIAMADVATQGNVLRIAAPITFAGSPATSMAPGETTTTTSATTTTVPATQPRITSAPGPAAPGPPAPGAVAIAGAASATDTTPPGPGATSTSSGTLPLTGLSPSVWYLIGTGLVLLDLGYLLWSATRPARRWQREGA